jgi:hypothetical protein
LATGCARRRWLKGGFGWEGGREDPEIAACEAEVVRHKDDLLENVEACRSPSPRGSRATAHARGSEDRMKCGPLHRWALEIGELSCCAKHGTFV